jgi:Protein of unknown function (DUF1367)
MTKFFCVKTTQVIFPHAECVEKFEKIPNGDCMVELTKPRNIKFHRKYMALLNFLFDHWEVEDDRYKNFEVFRKRLAILAGFCEEAYDIRGGIIVDAKSISFAEMDEVEFADLYDKTIDVGLKYVLNNYTRDDLERVCEEILHYA